MRAPPILVALAATVSTGCSGAGNPTGADPLPTFVHVDPQDFLGEVACGQAGGLQAYVATLVDLYPVFGADAGSAALPSSRPVACDVRVSFERVAGYAPHRYVADLFGFDRVVSPFGGSNSGSSLMVERGTTRLVEPRWRWSCGRRADGTYLPESAFDVPEGGTHKPAIEGVGAVFQRSVPVRPCRLVPTGLRVPLDCASTGPGPLRVDVEPGGTSATAAACGEPLDVTALEGGVDYTIRVRSAASDDAGNGEIGPADAAPSSADGSLDSAAADAALPGADAGTPATPDAVLLVCTGRTIAGTIQGADCGASVP